MSSNTLIDYINNLETATNVESKFRSLTQEVEKLGFLGCAYTLIPTLPNIQPVFMASKHFSAQFLLHYAEANFNQYDFTIKNISQGNLTPMNWWQEQANGQLNSEETLVIETARIDYDIHNGISIPLSKTAQYIAGASIISDADNRGFSQLLSEHLPILKTMVTIFHAQSVLNPVTRKIFYPANITSLSEREKLVLRMVIDGRAFKTLDKHVDGISPTAASNIMSELFAKFGVNKDKELAYIIGLHQLIDFY